MSQSKWVYYSANTLISLIYNGDFTSHICSAIDKNYPNQALGAKKIRGVWVIVTKSTDTRESLLRSNIIPNNKEVKLHSNNPYDPRITRMAEERVVIKDFSLWVSHDKILDFIKSMPQVEEVSKIYMLFVM